MIESISGRVTKIGSRDLTVLISGIGFSVQVIQPSNFAPGQEVNLFIHWSWNPEKGPALFGFCSEFERSVFCALIECPKIGPQISLQIMSQTTPLRLLEILALGDEQGLSSIHGIGPKKAKIIISQLQEKAGAMLSNSGSDRGQEDGSSQQIMLQEVISALKSMGYTSQEVSQAINAADKEKIKQTKDFSELTRSILSILLKQRSF